MKTTFLSVCAILILATSCQKNIINELSVHRSGVPAGYSHCGDATETPILAGQHTNVGSVTVWNDGNNLYVLYEATGNYRFRKTHLFAGACSAIPVNNAGNPMIGQFPYTNNHGSGVASFMRVIPLGSWSAGTELCISAHAEVVAYGSNGSVVFSQTGWAQGSPINSGGSWAMKFNYTIQSCLYTYNTTEVR